MYYGLLTIATLMFSIQFVFNQRFQRAYGNDLRAMLVFSAGTGAVGAVMLFALNGFRFEFTPFTLLMSVLATIDGMLCTFCSLKALGKINLSLYSVYMMLGGMALPFVVGILVYGEPLTLGKSICFAFILAAMFMSAEKDNVKGGWIWYASIFVLNGMSSVITQIFNEGNYPKAGAQGYTLLTSLVTVAAALVLLPLTRNAARKLNTKALTSMAGYGVISRIGSLLLVISLVHLPASAQYPFVTGGTMIFSTLWCFFGDKKPTKRELGAVALSFVGILALTLLP
ncbi:MAG: hypothetical protein E7463_12450 [Ruminococcaceae bacterium]|nr:hypothetical protein [Oscillospiraceae bacterium]